MSFQEVLQLTELEQAEYKIARLKLRDTLIDVLGDVNEAIEQSNEDSGELVGTKDVLVVMKLEVVREAFAEVTAPLLAAANRRQGW